jgi:hypothetical protein
VSARVHVEVERDESTRSLGFGRESATSPRVSLSLSFDLGQGEAALEALRAVVDEATTHVRRAGP